MVLPEILVSLTLTAFFTGVMVQTCLSIYRGVSAWERSTRMRQMLTASLHVMSRDIRMAGCNPFGKAVFHGIELDHALNGGINGFTVRHDKRGKSPDSDPDGDVEDPDERVEYLLDTDVLRRSHQPMATNLLKNRDDAPPFEFLQHQTTGLFHILLTAGEGGERMVLATSLCIRNPL